MIYVRLRFSKSRKEIASFRGMAVLCPDLYPTLFPHSPIDRQQGKWEQAFEAKIYGIVWVDSASNDQLSFWLPVNITQTSAGFRPWVKGGGGRGSSRPWDKGEDRSPKNFFRPFGPQFHLKIRGVGGGPPRPLPWIRHCKPSRKSLP